MTDTAEVLSTYLPGPTPERAHKTPQRVQDYWGPIRTGKSTSACWEIYFSCERAAAQGVSARWIIIRDTYRNLEDTTLKTWLDIFPDGAAGRIIKTNPVDYLLRTEDGTEHEILFRHGQTASDASSFLSSEFAGAFLEEVAPAFNPSGIVSPGIDESVFDMVLGRLVQKGVAHPQMILTSNPPPMQHWASRRIIDLAPEKLADNGWGHYWFPPEENAQNIRPGFYEELCKVWPEDMVRRFVKGERVAIYPGLPIFQKDFSERMHVRSNLRPIKGLPITLCVDSSGLAPAALFTQVDAKGRWLWLKELQGGFVDGKLSEQIGARRFAQLCKGIAATDFPGFTFAPGWGDPFRLEAKSDTDEKSWSQYFKAEGFELRPGVKPITDRIDGIRERLNIIIEGNPGILISKEGCPLSIEAMAGGYRWGLDPLANRVLGAEPVKDIFSHTMDAAGHAARKIFPIVKRYAPKEEKPVLPPSAMSA
jgi:hypothetical protein